MRRIITFTSLAIGLLAFVLPVTSAQAQATRTWISGVGDDVNPCSRTAPCKTFPGAISKTAAGGEIDTLDPGGFGNVTVVKAITLASEGTGEAGVLVAGTNGITVNAGAGDTVIVRGLQIDGGPIGSNSLSGVRFITGKALEIQNCTIRNFTGGSPNGYAVMFTPSASQLEELDISDSTFTTNGQPGGTATIGGAVLIQATGTPNVRASIVRTQMVNNTNGVRVDATLGTGGSVRVTLHDVMINSNANHGITIVTGTSGTKAEAVFDQSQSVNNLGDGVIANGANAVVYLNNSIVTNNGFNGLVVAGGGTMYTFKNNVVMGNNNDVSGTVTPTNGL